MLTALGEALFDIVPVPDPDNRADRTLSLMQAGGAPFNVAVTLARLEHDVRFCGTLSTDSLGQRLRQILRTCGIEVVPSSPVEHLTRVALVTPDDEQNAFTFYGNDPADTHLPPEVIDAALDRASGLYVSSMMMVNPRTRAVQLAMLELANRRGIPIFFDPNPRPSLWPSTDELMLNLNAVLSLASLVKLSRTDLDILGIRGDIREQFAALTHLTGAEIAITDGEQGCWAIIGGEVTHLRTPAVETVDPTGAGDVFMAALISAWVSGHRLNRAGLEFAAAAGALSASRHGAATVAPTQTEIREFLGGR